MREVYVREPTGEFKKMWLRRRAVVLGVTVVDEVGVWTGRRGPCNGCGRRTIDEFTCGGDVKPTVG